jgi:hypothetical protein
MENSMPFDKDRREKITRLVLRSLPLPIFRGPELYDLIRDLSKTRTNLDKKVEEALASIRNASSVVSELESTLTERTSTLEALRSEIERASSIAAVEEEKAAPILREVEARLSKGRTREWIVAFVINIAAGVLVFLAGAYFGPRLLQGVGPTSTSRSTVTQSAPPGSTQGPPTKSRELGRKPDAQATPAAGRQ